jgi:hypothetical protein
MPSTVFIEIVKLVKKYRDLIEPEGSSQCSQKIAIGSKMNQSTYSHYTSVTSVSNICFNIILQSKYVAYVIFTSQVPPQQHSVPKFFLLLIQSSKAVISNDLVNLLIQFPDWSETCRIHYGLAMKII